MYKGRILARSPYFVTAVANTAPILSAKLLVWVWTGDVTSQPANPEYTIDKLPIKGDDDSITFEISAIVKDFINFEGGASPESIWVATQISMVDSAGIDLMPQDTYIANLGYGYFNEGVNPEPSVDETTFKYSFVTLGFITSVSFEVLTTNQAIESGFAGDSYDVHKPSGVTNVALTTGDGSDDYIGLVNQTSFVTDPITKVVLKNGAAEIKTFNIEYDTECAGVTAVDFISKNGERQQMQFTGRTTEATSVSKDTYKRNTGGFNGSDYTYNPFNAQINPINIQSKQLFTLNTGWVSDSMNEVFRQFMLSEYHWLRSPNQPIKLNTGNIQYKENKKDKLINYTFEFEEANNLINDVY